MQKKRLKHKYNKFVKQQNTLSGFTSPSVQFTSKGTAQDVKTIRTQEVASLNVQYISSTDVPTDVVGEFRDETPNLEDQYEYYDGSASGDMAQEDYY